MKKSSFAMVNPLSLLIKKLSGTLTNRLVLFEGGLGSQIISYMLVETLLAKGENPVVDFSYFDNNLSGQEVSHWKWELDAFGIDELEYRNQFNLRPRERYILKLIKTRRGFSGRSKNEAYLLKDCDFNLISQVLSIPVETHSVLNELELQPFQYSMVHIRKGDYLKVSSRVISSGEALKALNKFKHLNFGNTIFITDGEFSAEEIKEIQSSSLFSPILFLDSKRYTNHALHGMMRLSKILVTSNSTFSWTAGLLNRYPESIVLSPTHFFRNPPHDELFQTASDWMVLK